MWLRPPQPPRNSSYPSQIDGWGLVSPSACQSFLKAFITPSNNASTAVGPQTAQLKAVMTFSSTGCTQQSQPAAPACLWQERGRGTCAASDLEGAAYDVAEAEDLKRRAIHHLPRGVRARVCEPEVLEATAWAVCAEQNGGQPPTGGRTAYQART